MPSINEPVSRSSRPDRAELSELCALAGVREDECGLLRAAVTHRSYTQEADQPNYERLEYLGDAVLQLAVGHYLYTRTPAMPEGDMSRLRASIVSETALASCARRMGLSKFLQLGIGERKSGGDARSSILADVVEALFGAIYLMNGNDAAAQKVLEWLAPEIEMAFSGGIVQDYKTMFQELVQKDGAAQIDYTLIRSWGPDHDKRFETAVCVNGVQCGTGIGASRKEAEQQAAKRALEAKE